MPDHEQDMPLSNDLETRLREAYDPADLQAEKLARRVLESDSGQFAPKAKPTGWGWQLAAAGAFSVLLAVGMWQSPSPDDTLMPPLPAEHVTAAQKPATLKISNESGFVTVTTEGSQWIVLPGDNS